MTISKEEFLKQDDLRSYFEAYFLVNPRWKEDVDFDMYLWQGRIMTDEEYDEYVKNFHEQRKPKAESKIVKDLFEFVRNNKNA